MTIYSLTLVKKRCILRKQAVELSYQYVIVPAPPRISDYLDKEPYHGKRLNACDSC